MNVPESVRVPHPLAADRPHTVTRPHVPASTLDGDATAAPSRRTSALGRSFDTVIDVFNAAGTLLIVALALLVNADVFGRALFNAPLAGVPELAGLTIVVIVFLQVPFCLRDAHLTRSEAFLDKLLQRHPALALALDAVYHLMGALVFAIIAYAAVGMTERAWTGGEYEGAHGVFTIPVWPVKAVVLIGSAAVAVQFLRVAFARFASLRRGDTAAVTTFAAGEEL